MKKYLLILVSVVAVTCITACSIFAPNYSALPADATADQKKAAITADVNALKAKAVATLSSPAFQKSAHDALVAAGKIALAKLADPADQQNLKNQLFAWGNSFDSLATGQAVTLDDLSSTAATFNTTFDATKSADFINQVDLTWSMVFPLLQQASSSDLYRQWLVVFSTASRDIAGQPATTSS